MSETCDYREETLFYLGECFRDLSTQIGQLPIPSSLGSEEAEEQEFELIDSGVKAFQIATGILTMPIVDIPTISSLLATNQEFHRKLQELVLAESTPSSREQAQSTSVSCPTDATSTAPSSPQCPTCNRVYQSTGQRPPYLDSPSVDRERQADRAIQEEMRRHLIDWNSVDSDWIPKKTVYADQAHTLGRGLIVGSVWLMVTTLGLSGGSTGDIDLYRLNIAYLKDPDLRQAMNKLLREQGRATCAYD